MRHLSALAFLLALAGCSFSRSMERAAVDQNQFVARTANTVTFLNILRAKDDRPLHFTSISRMSGSISAGVTASTGLDVQLSGGADASIGPAIGGEISTNPSYDIAIYDSQEFQKGILQPIAPATLNFYLRTGWRPDLITVMTVQRVEFIAAVRTMLPAAHGEEDIVIEAGETLATLVNQPSDRAAAARFMAFISCYALAPLQRSGEVFPLKRFRDVPTASLADLAQLDGKKIDLGKGPDGGDNDWVVRKAPGGETVRLVRDHSRDNQGSDAVCRDLDVMLAGDNRSPARARIGRYADSAEVSFTRADQARSVKTDIAVTFRSVDGVIYFLGQYARGAIDKDQPIYTIKTGDGVEDLLVVKRGRGGRYDLNAELNGYSYHIPRDGAGRSYEAITLVEQLFNLNKTGQAIPLSTAVRVLK